MKAKAVSFAVSVVAVMAIVAIFACSASAETATSHSGQTSVDFQVVHQKGWVGVQEHIKVQHNTVCEWFKTFYNSDYVVGQTNQKPRMYIDHNGYLCKDKFSPTGWQKQAGGHTHSHCHNIAQPKYEKPKYKVVKPPSIEIDTSTEVKVKVRAQSHAVAYLACGSATGNGYANGVIKVRYNLFAKSIHSESLRLKLAASVVAKAKAQANAEAKVVCSPPEIPKAPEVPKPAPSVECQAGYFKDSMGNCVAQSNQAEQTCTAIGGTWNTINQKCKIKQINVNCGTVVDLEEVYVEGNLTINIENETCVNKEEKTEPPPPPPTCEELGTCPPPPVEEEKYTEVSCTGFEEITGGGSFLVDCEVNTNTGRPISLSAHSNDSNTRVSGINCYSNGGSQTCPSTGGTFEFRVSGINSSSSIKYSSITAVASAGGVESKPFVSDPFPVDPEEGGFKN